MIDQTLVAIGAAADRLGVHAQSVTARIEDVPDAHGRLWAQCRLRAQQDGLSVRVEAVRLDIRRAVADAGELLAHRLAQAGQAAHC
ncbi:MAG: hypothetical protein C0475_05840 [Planctomyces sp.]|nr:hypothetical protein [Planctomyces sp.]MBA4038940.1 hypothetical protein [Planctomyces sp.]MBA4119128.1 hypothetical protein [Isosphaera sp.]